MQESRHEFRSGLDLSESFYEEAVEPLVSRYFPDLSYAAALIGSGSEVLGFDTEMSCDHDWGPRLMLFVEEEELTASKAQVERMLSEKLPRTFLSYPTGFTAATANGVQLLDYSEAGPLNHRVEVLSVAGFISGYLGIDSKAQLAVADWLTVPEQKLLAVTAGRVFRDDVGLEQIRGRLAYYPDQVWLYLLASCWSRIEQEEHLLGRAGLVGDELGSSIIGARLVRDLMRLCFLMEKSYAPYAKWFGTAFRALESGRQLYPVLECAVASPHWQQRQQYLCQAYEFVAHMHNRLEITEPLSEKVSQFHDRPFLVISSGVFSSAIADSVGDPVLKKLLAKPLIGGIDLVCDNTDILSNSLWRPVLRTLYTDAQ